MTALDEAAEMVAATFTAAAESVTAAMLPWVALLGQLAAPGAEAAAFEAQWVEVVEDQGDDVEFEPGELFEGVTADVAELPAVWRATEGEPELILAWSQLPEPAREFWPDIVDAIVLGV